MNVSLIFVAFVISALTLYMMNRFVKRPGIIMVFVLLVQFLSATVVIFSLAEKVLTIPEVELAVIAGGIFLPSVIVVHDHVRMIRKRKEKGFDVPLIEPKNTCRAGETEYSCFLENADLDTTWISASAVFDSLALDDRKFAGNVNKQLKACERLIRQKKYDSAALQYRLLFSLFPYSPYIAYNAGYLYCLTGKYTDAVKMSKKAMSVLKRENRKGNGAVPDDKLKEMLLFNMGYALYHAGKYEKSIKCYQKVIELNPDSTGAYKNTARAYLAMDMEDYAAGYLEKGRSDMNDSLLRVVLGSIYYKRGETGKALEVLNEITGKDIKRSEVLKYKGKAALKEKKFEEAERCFSKLTELEPEEPLNYYHLALAQRELKRSGDALKTYERGLAVNPDDSRLLYNAALLLDETGNREQAVNYLYKSIEGNEQTEDEYNCLGVLLGQMGRYHEAIQVFDAGIRLFGKSYRLYFNRGVVLEMSRRFEDAELSFEKAYELNRHDPELIYHYAAVLIELRRFEKALKIYKTSLSEYPDDAELYYGLSKVYACMGEKDLAVDLLKKVLETDPSYKSRIIIDNSFKVLKSHEGYKSLTAS